MTAILLISSPTEDRLLKAIRVHFVIQPTEIRGGRGLNWFIILTA